MAVCVDGGGALGYSGSSVTNLCFSGRGVSVCQ